MNKKELRKLIAQRKAEHTTQQRRQLSQDVCSRVLSTPEWAEAETVLLYHSLADEVDTAELIAAGVGQGKQILLPVVVGSELELRIYDGPETLKRGAYGILEPTGSLFPSPRYPQISLAIIPGVAFDKDGHRLGRGKGYYDRLLPRLTGACKVGICWNFQLLEHIPTEDHDITMNRIVYN